MKETERSDKPAAAFYPLHWAPEAFPSCQQHGDPEHCSDANGKYCWKWKKKPTLPKKFPFLHLYSITHRQRKHYFSLQFHINFFSPRTALSSTSPRAEPFPFTPKPRELRSTSRQQKLPGNRDCCKEWRIIPAFPEGLRRKTRLSDNVKIQEKGRSLLRLMWSWKSKKILLWEASALSSTRKTLDFLETLLGFHLLRSLEFSLDPLDLSEHCPQQFSSSEMPHALKMGIWEQSRPWSQALFSSQQLARS